MDPKTGEHLKRKSTRTTDRRQAEAIAQEWLANGTPDEPTSAAAARQTTFCDYLKAFWDFDHSEYFKELITMGKESTRAHADEMRKMIDRYFTDYFKTAKLIQIDEVKLQKFLVYLKTEKKLSGGTVNHARNVAFVALRAGDKAAERGIPERKEVEKLFKAQWRDPRSRLITLIASQTGMRISEIRALRVFNIHEDRINVDCSWSRRDGGFAPTKNREKRTIPIMPEL